MNSGIALVTQSLQHSQVPVLFLDAVLKSFLVLMPAGAVILCWRHLAASTRHLVWFLALTGLLGLPVCSYLVPKWQKPLWALGTRGGSGNELTLTLEFAPVGTTTPPVQPSPALAAGPDTGIPSSSASVSRRLSADFSTRWVVCGLLIWLGGAALILCWVACGRWRLRALRNSGRSLTSTEWAALLEALCRELDLRRQIILLQTAEDVMPVTWGWWRPVILLPAEADQWSPQRRRLVLLHELAHVKRWDCLTQMVARLACAIYWFNPLVWLAARRMCIERERASDDLVLNLGCKASDYATHLVEIARRFTRVPQVAAIAMARSSNLEGRIAAIVDVSRRRCGPPALLLTACCIAGVGLLAAIAAQKPQEITVSAAQQASARPWFDERLRAFFTAKAAQARQLGEGQIVAPEVWPYFEAGMKGDWNTATNLWAAMRRRAHQYEGTTPDETLDKVWGPILETDLAWEQFANWKQKYVLDYGNDIIQSISPGSIYFGGTDPGRGVITAMSKAHAEADPFFTLTQNALADGTYLDYLRAMYGRRIYTPTPDDSQKCFQEYTGDAERRLKENKLKAGEDVTYQDAKIQVKGQIAVMAINGLLTKIIFDRNPDREFYVEESFPLDWMYPHLLPNGLILKINRQPLPGLSEAIVQQDHQYWSQYLRPILGDWLNEDTPVAQVAAFAQRVYLQHDLNGFSGDPEFIEDTWAQKAFSKLRSSIAGLYSWRLTNTGNPDEKQRMAKEADFAFRQAFALCPNSPEALFRYVNLLVESKRVDDALLLAETSVKLEPGNTQVKSLFEQLKSLKQKQ